MRVHRQVPGFTLIELLVVMAIISLLISLAVPRYFGGLAKAKETALQQTLTATRDSIDKFFGDTGKYPENLEALVTNRYLRSLPLDPMTESSTTWTVVPPDNPEKGGVYDIHSTAEGVGRNGKPFKEW